MIDNDRSLNPTKLTWTCHICGEHRPGAKIAVAKHDISKRYALGPGSVWRIIRYCNDRRKCTRRAKKGKRAKHGATKA